MCSRTRRVLVTVPKDLAVDGKARRKYVKIDACVAPIIRALQRGGVDMRGSCCGHGKREGHVHLQDGRALLVLSVTQARRYFTKGIPALPGT